MIYKTSDDKLLTYEIIRKNNKNVYFRVKKDLKLYITAPLYLSQKSITNLIFQNEAQIIKMYDKMVEKSKDIGKYIFLGQKYYIQYENEATEVLFKDKQVITKNDEMLEEFTTKSIHKIYAEEIALCQECFATLPEFTWQVKTLKTRWGVCNKKKKEITLNAELIKYERDLIDYVIIHELCHFFVGNHSKEFWNLVKEAYPRYKEARRKLKE